jgi:hypothetical protein
MKRGGKVPLDEEKRRYVDSFGEAMRAVDAEYVRTGTTNRTCERLKEAGLWTAEMMAFQYVLIIGGMSTLPRSQRDYVLQIGAMARGICEMATERAEKEKKK